MSKNSFIKQLVELTNSTSNLYSCIEELDKKLTTIRESNMELVSIYRILSYTKAALEFKKKHHVKIRIMKRAHSPIWQ